MKKEWKNPEINGLHAIETNTIGGDCDCTFGVTKGKKHYCHVHHQNNHSGTDEGKNHHFVSVGCTEVHMINGQPVNCCCYGGNQHS